MVQRHKFVEGHHSGRIQDHRYAASRDTRSYYLPWEMRAERLRAQPRVRGQIRFFDILKRRTVLCPGDGQVCLVNYFRIHTR